MAAMQAFLLAVLLAAPTPDIAVSIKNVGGNARAVSAEGDINASAEKVFNAYTDFPAYRRIFSQVKRADVRSRVPQPVAFYEVELPWPFGKRWVTCNYQIDRAKREIRWQRSAGTITSYEGTINIQALGANKSRVRYTGTVDLNLGVPIPDWVMDWAQKHTLPGIIRDVRSYLARGAR